MKMVFFRIVVVLLDTDRRMALHLLRSANAPKLSIHQPKMRAGFTTKRYQAIFREKAA